ncbi:MAG: LacI family DNA-binding transcriptional regulator [Opitutaceae bacterium]|jgi:LacI family transcriptional regulator/LacI family repressor for deo operon, udp, cdd, tsx, nupC, and nupG
MSSLTDVAKAAGVSIATVSRVISHPEKVASQTQIAVRKAMKDLDYQPNRVARRLRQRGGKRQLLGLIIPDIQNPFFAEIARGVEDVAYANQFAVMLCNSDENLEKESFYLDVMRAESVDGIILPPINDQDPAVRKIAESGMPIVTVDRSLSDSTIDKVEVDNRQGAFDAVAHLIKLGHNRIGLITGRINISTSRDRKLGYEQALAAGEIPLNPDYVRVGDYKQASGYALTDELLALPVPPTALFVANNLMAVGAIEAVHKRNLKIPRDVAIIGFDDLPWADALDPPLTMVRQPAYEVGRAAAELLLNRLGSPDSPAAWLRLRPRLIFRKSC